MAELKSLIVNGVTRLNNTGYAKQWYAEGVHHTAVDRNDYVILAGGSYTSLSSLSSTHSHSQYVLKAGDTMSGTLYTAANYHSRLNGSGNGIGALHLNNSDITGVNSIITGDLSESWLESLAFKRSNGNYDTFRAANGTFYFGLNNGINEYVAIHSGNYTNYTVTKTGGGASGKWSINVTGSAGKTDMLCMYGYARNTLDAVKGLHDGAVRYILEGNGVRGLHFSWDSQYYDTQIYIPNHVYDSTQHLKWRSDSSNGVWESWMTILDTANVSPSIGISGNKIRITVGGVNSSYITVPYATNSDTVDGYHASDLYVVKQNATSGNNTYNVLFKFSANNTAETSEVRYDSAGDFQYNPSTNNLKVYQINGVKLKYSSIDSSRNWSSSFRKDVFDATDTTNSKLSVVRFANPVPPGSFAHSTGIAFQGSDTQGMMVIKYNEPGVSFSGGNGNNNTWSMNITGSNGSSYDLSSFVTGGPYLPLAGGTMTGTIKRTYSATGQTPFIQINGSNYDNYIWQVSSGTTTNQYYGFGLKYIGSGSGVDNRLRLYADNQNGTDVIAFSINNSGQVGIGTDSSTAYRLQVDGSTYIKSGPLYVNDYGSSWVSGMTVNPRIWFNAGNNLGDTVSYHAFWAMKSYGGNVVNYGGLNKQQGFYGYYAGRTANSYDWSFTVDTDTGVWTTSKNFYSVGTMYAYGFHHRSIGDDNYALTAGGSYKKIGNASGNIPISNNTVCSSLNADKLDGYEATSFFRQRRDYFEGSRSMTLNRWRALFSYESSGAAARAFILNIECHHDSTVTSKTFYIHTSLSGGATIREFYSKDFNTGQFSIRVSSSESYWKSTRVDLKINSGANGTVRFKAISVNNGGLFTSVDTDNVAALSGTYVKTYTCRNIEEAIVENSHGIYINGAYSNTAAYGFNPTSFTANYRIMRAVKQKPTTVDANTIYFVLG